MDTFTCVLETPPMDDADSVFESMENEILNGLHRGEVAMLLPGPSNATTVLRMLMHCLDKGEALPPFTADNGYSRTVLYLDFKGRRTLPAYTEFPLNDDSLKTSVYVPIDRDGWIPEYEYLRELSPDLIILDSFGNLIIEPAVADADRFYQDAFQWLDHMASECNAAVIVVDDFSFAIEDYPTYRKRLDDHNIGLIKVSDQLFPLADIMRAA